MNTHLALRILLQSTAITGTLFIHALTWAGPLEDEVSRTLDTLLGQTYPNGNYEYTVAPVAASIHLKPCDSFSAQVKSKQLSGRVPVHVRCLHPANWSLYASADVKVAVDVLVTSRNITKGELILADAVEVQTQWLHQVRNSYISRLEDVTGKVARRGLRANTTLTLNHVATPMAVDKGERVHIEANSGRVTITSYGTALASGRIGEQIQVRNDSSTRVIRPWVVGPGRVATSAPDFDS